MILSLFMDTCLCKERSQERTDHWKGLRRRGMDPGVAGGVEMEELGLL
jgi:hypothetical protein